MAKLVMIIGESGTGKSTAMRNLDMAKSALISISGNPLPFRGGEAFPKIVSDDPKVICQKLTSINKRDDKKVIVVDDFQYLMANMWMRSLLDKKTKDSEFSKYKEIGYHTWTIIRTAQQMKNEKIVIFLAHTNVDESGTTRCKTVGRLLDEKIVLEGMFSIVLNTVVHNERQVSDRFYFQTQNNGHNTTKSPMGMFYDEEIPNDLQLVVDSINSYYGGNQK